MSAAFVDTTVLTDRLLKPGEPMKRATAALAKYSTTRLPVYGIKEFQLGPLSYYIWWHNKLVATRSYSVALDALHKLSRTPQRYRVSTALEALQSLGRTLMSSTMPSVAAKYPGRTMDEVMTEYYMTATRNIVLKAWKQRRRVVSEVVVPCACYPEDGPSLRPDGSLQSSGQHCRAKECAMAPALAADHASLGILEKIARSNPKPESQKRASVLRDLARKGTRALGPRECRALGDAVFAFFAPKDSVILTTNVADHLPLAGALGKAVEAP